MRAIELYNLALPQDMVVSLHSMVKIEAFLSFSAGGLSSWDILLVMSLEFLRNKASTISYEPPEFLGRVVVFTWNYLKSLKTIFCGLKKNN